MKMSAKELIAHILGVDFRYPVGSYYETSDSTFDPNTAWGGVWILDSKGKVTVGYDPDQTEFNALGKTGGEKTHKHKYGIQLGGYYGDTIFEIDTHAGVLEDGNGAVSPFGNSIGSYTVKVNSSNTYGARDESAAHYQSIANTETKSSLQPYIVVNRWHRTA